jgi:RNA polymerase sigma-70 factor, ECF subfamily
MSEEPSKYINLCRQGNTSAFGPIVSEYRQMIYSLAFRLLCNDEDAKDATQETFIRIWRNIDKFKYQYKFSTWVYRIATNICYDKLRSEQKSVRLDISKFDLCSEINQSDTLEKKELRALLIRFTEKLTPKQKIVFTMSEIMELDVTEITAITGMTSAKIKSNLYLAKKFIKKKITEEYEEP